MRRLEDRLFRALLLAQASAFSCLVYLIFLEPSALQQSTRVLVERFVLSFHLPAACAIYVCGAACLLASALYLKSPSNTRNAWARASADCACVFGALTVLNGTLLTKYNSGVYWAWADRLPTKLLLIVLVFGGIVVFRRFAGEGESERKFAAALGIFGAVNVPLIHHAVDLWMPAKAVIPLASSPLQDPSRDLVLGCIATALLLAMLLWFRARLALSADRLAEMEQNATGAGLLDS